jgi:tRNA pseudouridine55 synthase
VRERPDIDGVLIVDKPIGPTSHDVVATARRALRVRRIGHTGTLDPNASGVLPLVVGRATRLAQYLSGEDKEYEATIRFGLSTDSYDSRGRIIEETGAVPSRDAIVAALEPFRGEFDQMPPAYSAKSVGGERAYALARRAKPVALAPARVTAHELELLSFEPPVARLRIVCSAGFYIRSLAHDLGRAVGTGAILDALRRTRSGAFTAAAALSFGVLASGSIDALRAALIPMSGLLQQFPSVALTPEGVDRVMHGQEIRPQDATAGVLPDAAAVRLLSPSGTLLGVAKPSKMPGFLHGTVVLGLE